MSILSESGASPLLAMSFCSAVCTLREGLEKGAALCFQDFHIARQRCCQDSLYLLSVEVVRGWTATIFPGSPSSTVLACFDKNKIEFTIAAQEFEILFVAGADDRPDLDRAQCN